MPQKVWTCARGFTEAEWNDAYKQWVDHFSYCEDEDSDFNVGGIPSKKRNLEGNTNRVLGEVDELDLVAFEPDKFSEIFH